MTVELPRPLETGGSAVYVPDPALVAAFAYEDRFGARVEMAHVRGGRLLAPRAACPIGIIDRRVIGEAIAIRSRVVPRNDEQARVIREATALLEAGESFVLEAATGFGKTACAASILSAISRKTLIVVHKTDLLEQWRAALLQHTELRPEDIGTIQGPAFEVEGRKVTLAMIQTLTSREWPEALADAFGLVVFDEVHHLGADVFARAASMFRGKLRLGLSATPQRSDGRERTIGAHIGPVRVEARREPLRPLVFTYRSSWRCPRAPSGERIPHEKARTMHVERSIAADPERNRLLVELLLKAHGAGRRTVLFSSLVKHLVLLEQMAIEAGIPAEHVLVYHGKTPKSRHPLVYERPVVLTTWGMLGEGSDVPTLDCALLATPRSNITQAVGRILRELPEKPQPIVLDVQDMDSPVFSDYARSRAWIYRKLRADVRERPSPAEVRR